MPYVSHADGSFVAVVGGSFLFGSLHGQGENDIQLAGNARLGAKRLLNS